MPRPLPDGPWKTAPKAASFAGRCEFQVSITTRLIEDQKNYWVAAGGGPMYSVLLARRLYAPNALYVTEDGIVGADPVLPLDPVMTVVAEKPSYRALQWTTMNGIGDHCAVGYMDVGISERAPDRPVRQHQLDLGRRTTRRRAGV